MKNGLWMLASPGGVRAVGWGDLAFADLDAAANALKSGELLVVAPEREWSPPPRTTTTLGAAVSRYGDHPWTNVSSVRSLAFAAEYAVVDGNVRYVDQYERANRQGEVWIRSGARWTAGSRLTRPAPRRILAITPARLARLLDELSMGQ